MFYPIGKIVVWRSIAFIAEGISKRYLLSEVDVLGRHASLLQLPPDDRQRRALVLNPLEREDHFTTQHRVEENRRHVVEVPNASTGLLHAVGDAGAGIALELVDRRGEVVTFVECATGQGDWVGHDLVVTIKASRRSAS